MLNNPAWQFFLTMGIGLAGTIVGTYITRPTSQEVLENFYRTTRPFGFWGPLRNVLSPAVKSQMKKEHVRDVAALPFALVWQITLFLLPMQLLIKSYQAFAITLGIFLVSFSGLYVIWLKHLWGNPGEDIELQSGQKNE
jgi:hypothetical protein